MLLVFCEDVCVICSGYCVGYIDLMEADVLDGCFAKISELMNELEQVRASWF